MLHTFVALVQDKPCVLTRVAVLAGLLASGAWPSGIAQSSTSPKIDTDQIVQQTVLGEHDCTKEDRQFVFQAETKDLLGKDETIPTQTCRAVIFPGLPSAQIVQVTGWKHTDVFVSITVLRASQQSPVRLIAAYGGMSEDTHPEDSPENKAAFNELLSAARKPIPKDHLLDLSILYLFMVGHPPNEKPRPMQELLMTSDVTGFTEDNHATIKVTVHQRESINSHHAHREWILSFDKKDSHLSLTSVIPEHND